MNTVHQEVEGRSQGRRQHIQDKQEFLDWLGPFIHSQQHSFLSKEPKEGTGQWLLESPEFKAWLNDDQKTLFWPGIPGTSKALMSLALLSYLQSGVRADENAGVANMCRDYQLPQTEEDLLKLLLKQFLESPNSRD